MSATATLPGRGAYGRNLYGFAPAGGVSPTYPTQLAIYFKTTSITLEWGLVTGATGYKLQVASTPDFSGTLLVNTTSNNGRQHIFTDSGTNDTKRWWRWAASLDSGASYLPWSEVGSYWINTGGAQNVTLPRNVWGLINPSDVTDVTELHDFPMYLTKQAHLYRVRDRNRLGTLLSEYVTLKGAIQLGYDNTTYMDVVGFREMRRFNEVIKTFFLCTFKDNAIGFPTPNIWKVQFESDPELTMLAAGRQDLYTGSLSFMEV